MNRRSLLFLAATGTTAASLSGLAQATSVQRDWLIRSTGSPRYDYSRALQELVALAERDLAASGAPGMTLCMVDAEGFAAIKTLGWADKDRQVPVRPAHLFQIGSISKSFAALCAYRLADEGKIDLDSPLSRYLPDFPLPPEPISVQQVLSHTSGLPLAAPLFPLVPENRLWTGFKPGTRFSYSNTGYELIGKLIERVHGKPYPLALRELVVRPLGIQGMREVIQTSDRGAYAVGYSPLDASGPNMPGVRLGQTQWIACDSAAGNIGTTADAMARYLQFLIAVGRRRGAPLFSDASARRFGEIKENAAAAAFGKGDAYASGLEVVDLDGRAVFRHLGGMWGFTSLVIADPDTGVGLFVGVNAVVGGYEPTDLGDFGCRLLRHAREGGRAPTPKANLLYPVPEAESYSGTYFASDGDQFRLVARGGRLFLAADGREGAVQPLGDLGFISDHPRFSAHFIDFERSGDSIRAVWFGPTLYGRGTRAAQPPTPVALAALQGTYISDDPWSGLRRSVVAQGERLLIESTAFYHRKSVLRSRGDYWSPANSESTTERIRFEEFTAGVPQRLNFSGRHLRRVQEI